MARAKKVSELTALTTPANTDLLLIVSDPDGAAESKKITIGNLFGHVSSDVVLTGKLVLPNTAPPTTTTSTGTKGEIRFDGGYVYICTATNTWRRSLLETW